jgi:DNA-binding NtrC family response regulator
MDKMADKKNNLIFVVEDNKAYNKVITEYLEKHNYVNVKAFFSGEECVEAIKKGEEPDIIIQDYFLEKMNGIDVLRKVKQTNPRAEFIFLTSHEDMEVAVNTIKFGAYDYIIKDNITLDKVMDRIKKISHVKLLERKNREIQKYIYMASGIIGLIILFAILYFVFDVFGMN